MSNFNHAHVLTLRGVCLDGGPAPYIIMSFMANGSLLAYLKENRKKLVVSGGDKEEYSDDVSCCLIISWLGRVKVCLNSTGGGCPKAANGHVHSGCQGDGVPH